MAKNYESENKNSKNATNRSYESEINSQGLQELLHKKQQQKQEPQFLRVRGRYYFQILKYFKKGRRVC